MKIKVTKDLCEIKENEIWNVGDYNVHTVQVELSPEFNGLVNKVRYFVEDNSYDMLITDNVAQVPYEATLTEGTIKIGVYGYDADTNILVQSTSPVNKYISSGTYTGEADNTEPLTPTDKEQMETAIQKNTNDITDLKANKQDKLISGVNIKTINNESILSGGNLTLVTEEADPIFTNSPAYSITDNDITYWNNKANMSDIPDVSNFITKDVDDLTYYTKSTDMQNAIDSAVNIEKTSRENADVNLQNQIDAITVSSDVVDVVSTYQDLVDYDTQHIKANDIIKVMQDSTHDNAISYYRWVIVNHVGSWVYVGSEGPYYTKSETDTLLNAKQNTLISGQNIKTINSESLLGEGNITIQGGGSSDYEDLTNKPKINNVELNGNKSLSDLGIQPAGNYALESDMTEAQNDIENLQTENERLKATLPTTTGEGENVTLDKTAEMEFVKPPLPRGNTKQDTTTGKNLLPPLDSGSLNGLTFTTNSNGITTISGTTTSVITYFKNVNKILPAGTYTLSINLSYTPPANSSQLILQDINNVRLATINLWKITSKTFTLSADTEIKNYYLFSNSGIQHNGTISIQLEKGSTATSYEPYTGGIPSPNPDYPQEIHTITGNNEIKISNKNLIASVQRNGNSLFFNGTNSQTEYIFKAGTYTLSFVNENITSVYIKTPSTNATSLGSNSPKTFTSDEDFNIWIYRSGMTSDETTNIQLEEGSIATEYVTHKEQTYPINLGDIEFCGIEDYKDVPFKNTLDSEYYNSSLELNKWYLKKNIGKVVFDGNTVFSNSTTNENFSSFFIEKNDMVINKTIMSNYFTQMPIGDATSASKVGIASHNTLARIYVTIPTSDVPISTFMSTHNTIVYYPLATPTYTLLNDTLQTQLEEISKALSYQGQTNITSNTIALFDVEAYQSTKLILENLDSRLTLVEG